jgi:nitrogen fixation/metabolism regulation signal transduction histidine kinase
MTGTFTVPMLAPQWFQAILQMPATLSKTITTADKNAARVTVEISTNSAVNRIWQKVVQLQISAMAIFFIYFLLGLILRVNERSWKRLALATNRFKTGDHGVRMDVRGSHEERLLATTFNGMAEEIESILLTLQKSQREQSEQMHFTLQLLNALPVSTFFRIARASVGGEPSLVQDVWHTSERRCRSAHAQVTAFLSDTRYASYFFRRLSHLFSQNHS